MNKHVFSLYIVILLLVSFLFFNKCGTSSKVATFKTPEVKGVVKEFKTVQVDSFIKDSIIYKNSIIKLINPIDKELLKKYICATDSIEKLNLHINAITIRNQISTIDNDTINLVVNTKTRGDLLDISAKYIIKPRIVDIKIPETKFAVYAGLELGNNQYLNNFNTKFNILFQNKSNNMLTLGYDLNNNYYIGYNKQLFNY